jgi:thermitase
MVLVISIFRPDLIMGKKNNNQNAAVKSSTLKAEENKTGRKNIASLPEIKEASKGKDLSKSKEANKKSAEDNLSKASGGDPNKDYQPGELLIKLKDDQPAISITSLDNPSQTNIELLNSIDQKFNVSKIEKIFKDKEGKLGKYYKLYLPIDVDIKQAAAEYKNNSVVEIAVPNCILKLTASPNDTSFANQWGLHNTGQTINIGGTDYSGTAGADINAPEAWDIITNSSNVVIAVVDTGIKYDHEDLVANMWDSGDPLIPHHGWDFINDDDDPMDDNGHGTHCAGISAGATNNSKGIAGVAGGWNGNGSKIIAVKVMKADGTGDLDKMLQGVTFAADKGAHIISMSIGLTESELEAQVGPGHFPELLAFWQPIINDAYSKGCVLIASAGNSELEELGAPACCDNVLSVAATGFISASPLNYVFDDRIAYYSTYGTWIDVSAPGSGIYSTYFSSTSSYEFMSETSMACPMTSGVAALVKAHYTTLTNTQVINQVKNTTNNIDSLNPSYVGKMGTGRINAYQAVYAIPVTAITNQSTGNNKGVNTGPVTVTINGVGFVATPTIKLQKSGQTDIEGTGVTFVTSDQINCTFDITGAAAGYWNVAVTNPDTRSGTLLNGFEVTSPSPPPTPSPTPTPSEGPIATLIETGMPILAIGLFVLLIMLGGVLLIKKKRI